MPTASTYVLALMAASLSCDAQVAYRLAGSNVATEGRLEVLYNNTWGTICDDSFSNVEANIACEHFGYSDGGEFIYNQYGPGEGSIWLDDVKCNGTEQSITDCPRSPWGSTNCDHDEDVSIRCHGLAEPRTTTEAALGTSRPISYRLVGPKIPGEGRLEVYYNSKWGTVCDDSFSDIAASVACRSLGFLDGGQFLYNKHGPGVDPIWLDDVKCNGTEQSIADCDHRPWGQHDCDHREDVSIRCWTDQLIEYKLVGSKTKEEGRLEVYRRFEWGTVCDDYFGDVEASVACRSLGYSDSGQFIGSKYGGGEGPILLDNVHCKGTEQSIADCYHLPWGKHDCNHREDVSIGCWTDDQIKYKLTGSSGAAEGRLEVYYDYKWGTVCDDGFGDDEAKVACLSLGYPMGGLYIYHEYGPGLGHIWLDDVKCRGYEQSIADCSHRAWGSSDCGHQEDVSIRCWTSAHIVYRLAGSSVTKEGRLEVKFNDKWGSVCNDGFSNVEASIACGSLGYSKGGEYIDTHYGLGEGPIWLGNVKCSGTEQSIADCSHEPWGEHDCDHGKYASIRCF